MPKLSIVVPVYNVEKYLNKCLDSILGQSFTDFELIIVDDGSTDSSGSICDKYAQIDKRVHVIHTENHGVVTARRTGVNFANGEYTTFVDSDDWLDIDFYHCFFSETIEKNADVLIGARLKRSIGLTKTTIFSPGFYDKNKLENIVFPQMIYDPDKNEYHILPSLWNKLFRTELIKTVYDRVDPRVTLGEDAVVTYPCIAKANSLYIVDNVACYNYREDHISMVNNCDVRLFEKVCALAVNINQQFSDMPEVFNDQVQHFIAYNGFYAVCQVLLRNRVLKLNDRIRAIKEFLNHPSLALAFKQTKESVRSFKLKYKLNLASKHQLCLWALLKSNILINKLKSYFNRNLHKKN